MVTLSNMPRILLTAYGPYDDWETNVSWLVLQEVLRHLPKDADVVTRLYPVDFAEMPARLEQDLNDEIDVAIHLGQAPGNGRIELEAIGLNCGLDRGQRAEAAWPLVPGAPAAYHSELPLAAWAQQLRGERNSSRGFAPRGHLLVQCPELPDASLLGRARIGHPGHVFAPAPRSFATR